MSTPTAVKIAILAFIAASACFILSFATMDPCIGGTVCAAGTSDNWSETFLGTFFILLIVTAVAGVYAAFRIENDATEKDNQIDDLRSALSVAELPEHAAESAFETKAAAEAALQQKRKQLGYRW